MAILYSDNSQSICYILISPWFCKYDFVQYSAISFAISEYIPSYYTDLYVYIVCDYSLSLNQAFFKVSLLLKFLFFSLNVFKMETGVYVVAVLV